MATHLTEEEQIEAFKRWWNENWVTIVLPLVAAVFLYVGWYWWKDYKQEQAEIASDQFEELNTIMTAAEAAGGLTDTQKLDVIDKAKAISDKFGSSLYADMSNLILAKVYVDDKEFDKAANLLNHVVQNGANASVSLLAQARLAKVYVELDRSDEALQLVANADDPAFASMYAEIRGDILAHQGNIGAAHTAYQSALEKLDPQAMSRSGLLQSKISATTVAKKEMVIEEDVEAQESAEVSDSSESVETVESEETPEETVDAGEAE